ncbi:MAG: universal stress protein [Thermosynechococcaceae cyanobacterium]
MGFQTILVSLDESDLGASVFQQALDIAIACQAQLHLLHAIQPPEQPSSVGAEGMLGGLSDLGTYPMFADPAFWEAQAQVQVDRTETWLQRYEAQAQQAGVVTAHSCPVGEPGAIICDVAKTQSTDLIVMGRRGLSGLAEAFMGSVSNYVVHHAPCSVLVVQTPSPAQP